MHKILSYIKLEFPFKINSKGIGCIFSNGKGEIKYFGPEKSQITKKEKINPDIAYSFVANIPMKIPINSNGTGLDPAKLKTLIHHFETETFGDSRKAINQEQLEKIALEQAKAKLGIVLGFNYYRSLDVNQNKEIIKLMTQGFADTTLNVLTFGFFYDPPWIVTKVDEFRKSIFFNSMPKNKQEEIFSYKYTTFQRARFFYEYLKKTNKRMAENFIRKAEGSIPRDILPFQGFRDTLNLSKENKYLIDLFRTKNPNSTVYSWIVDPDVISFRSLSGLGVLSAYEMRLNYWKQQYSDLPGFLSTGYRLARKYLFQSLAVELDMVIRGAVAQYFNLGCYYTECNTLVGILQDKSCIEVSFTNNSKETGEGLEWKRLAKHFLEDTRSWIGDWADFCPEHAIMTSMPTRMQKHKSDNTAIQTVAKADKRIRKDKKIVPYKNIIMALAGISQSHFSSDIWAESLRFALPKAKNAKQGITGKIRMLLIQMRNLYDPYTITKSLVGNSSDKKMSYVILNYLSYMQVLDSKMTFNQVNWTVKNLFKIENFRANQDILYQTRELLLKYFDQKIVDRLQNAARATGDAIWRFFLKYSNKIEWL